MSLEEFMSKNIESKYYPYAYMYIYAHGYDDLLQVPWMVKDADAAEAIYKKCVEKGIDWRTLYERG